MHGKLNAWICALATNDKKNIEDEHTDQTARLCVFSVSHAKFLIFTIHYHTTLHKRLSVFLSLSLKFFF